MKNTIEIENWKVARFIKRDKIAVKRWGKVWYRYELGNGLLHGEACVSQLHNYVPNSVLKAVKGKWPKDFANKA